MERVCTWCQFFWECNLLRVANVNRCKHFKMDKDLRVDILYACAGRVEQPEQKEVQQ